MLWVDPEPFESPFDLLTVLSEVEGLTALREITGRLLLPRSSKRGLSAVEGSMGKPLPFSNEAIFFEGPTNRVRIQEIYVRRIEHALRCPVSTRQE